MTKKFILHLSGTSCTGKSTLKDVLVQQLPGVYVINWDVIKKQLVGYKAASHKDQIKELSFGFTAVVCQEGLSVLFLAVIEDETDYQRLTDIAHAQDYTVVSIKLTAPLEILFERFRERIKAVKAEGKTISIMDEEKFLEQYKKGFFVPEGTPTFDTSVMNPEEIVGEVMKILSN